MNGTYNYIITNFIQILSLVIPTIVAIGIYIKQNKKKNLAFTKWYNGNIIDSKNKFLKNRISIHFENKELTDLSVAIFEFRNIGNEVIDKTDFIDGKPLIIEFIGGSIVSYNIKETYPKILREEISISTNGNKLEIKPFSINLKDGFIIEVFMSGEFKDFEIKQRIKGIDKISSFNSKKQKIGYLFGMMIFTVIAQNILTYNKSLISNISFFEAFKEITRFSNGYIQVCFYTVMLYVLYLFFRVIQLDIIESKYNGKGYQTLKEAFKKLFK